jgi:nitronate monooxygenase
VGALLERIGVELPIVQAGMGGGLAAHELAAAVSEAGGLGTIGILGPDQMRAEITAARRLTDRPIAVNLLLVLARRAHFEAAEHADVLVTFWGTPRRRTSGIWIHQVGSVEEALSAREAGADAVIAQGVEAGGHVRGTTPAAELLARVKGAVGAEYPVLLAGGVTDAADARERLEAGAEAVVSGTRFLMSDESGAHPAYKERLIGARETVLTELFGIGWPAPHRVVPNAATERWLRGDQPRTALAESGSPDELTRSLPGAGLPPDAPRGRSAPESAVLRPGRGNHGRPRNPGRRRAAVRRRVHRADRGRPARRRARRGPHPTMNE